jgi:Protein of unknown function (DUF1203)
MSYRVSGIPDTLASTVRETLRSPQYGHPAHAEVAGGSGPCRLCLRTFEIGLEERLLFTYQPFSDPAALPAPGPVFIHRVPCARYDALEFPETLRPLPLVVQGSGEAGALLVQELVADRKVEAVLDEVFEFPATRYAHLRNAEVGCFIARVDRGAPSD